MSALKLSRHVAGRHRDLPPPQPPSEITHVSAKVVLICKSTRTCATSVRTPTINWKADQLPSGPYLRRASPSVCFVLRLLPSTFGASATNPFPQPVVRPEPTTSQTAPFQRPTDPGPRRRRDRPGSRPRGGRTTSFSVGGRRPRWRFTRVAQRSPGAPGPRHSRVSRPLQLFSFSTLDSLRPAARQALVFGRRVSNARLHHAMQCSL